jgi:hypothetical protein
LHAFLVSLSAANTLHQDLASFEMNAKCSSDQIDPFRVFADAAGRFADACEKLDHLEDCYTLARTANLDILCWLISAVGEQHFDIVSELNERRKELSARQFYVSD